MRYMLPLLVLFIFTLQACKDSGKPVTTKEIVAPKPPVTPESDLSVDATRQLVNMINNYYGVKDALVNTNGAKADEAASKLMSAAEIFLAQDSSAKLNPQLRGNAQDIMKKSEAITTIKVDSIEAKRLEFAGISESLYKLATAAKLRHAGVYKEFCPMAFDHKGAFWLSNESEIKNPYYGKVMMECGEVQDSL